MTEGPSPAPTAALAAWLAAPSDPQRLAALVAASVKAPIAGGTIDRLPVAGLTALQQGGMVRFAGLRPAVRATAIIVGLASKLTIELTEAERHELDAQPFVMHLQGGEAVLDVHATAEQRRGIAQPFYHQWAAGLSAEAIVIDLHRVGHVNSVLIAWMLQIVQSAKPIPVHVRRAHAQVVTQLRQLRLDHLMKIG